MVFYEWNNIWFDTGKDEELFSDVFLLLLDQCDALLHQHHAQRLEQNIWYLPQNRMIITFDVLSLGHFMA